MKKIEINTPLAPAPVGPYSQAIMIEQADLKTLYVSGQIAIDPIKNKLIEPDIELQSQQVMENLGAILNAAGMNFNNVIKTTCYIADMNNFAKFNAIYGRYFTSTPQPARGCVEVARLPKDALIEVELIAIK